MPNRRPHSGGGRFWSICKGELPLSGVLQIGVCVRVYEVVGDFYYLEIKKGKKYPLKKFRTLKKLGHEKFRTFLFSDTHLSENKNVRNFS